MNFILKAVLALGLAVPSLSFAAGGGTYVGNGGHAILCTDPNLAKDIDYYVRPTGIHPGAEKIIKFINTLDYYLAKEILNPLKAPLEAPDIADFSGLDAQQVKEEIYHRFEVIGEPYASAFSCVRKNLGSYEDGIPAKEGLASTGDISLPIKIPSSCRIIQVVVRQGATFYFNPRNQQFLKWSSRSSVDQTAIMQLHEEFYAFATEVFGHKESSLARNLLASLLASKPTAEQLKKQLSFFGPIRHKLCGE